MRVVVPVVRLLGMIHVHVADAFHSGDKKAVGLEMDKVSSAGGVEEHRRNGPLWTAAVKRCGRSAETHGMFLVWPASH